jgi:hypothetical protein
MHESALVGNVRGGLFIASAKITAQVEPDDRPFPKPSARVPFIGKIAKDF